MKVLVLALGSDGDINPMVEIARAIKSRGHDVGFVANEYFADKVAAHGLDFIEMGDRASFEAVTSDPELWQPRRAFATVWKNLYKYLPGSVDALEKLVVPGKTVMVGTTLAIAGRILQEKAASAKLQAVPLSTVHLSPCCLISRFEPPTGPDFEIPSACPQIFKDIYFNLVDRFLLDGNCRADLNTYRRSLGLAPVKQVFSRWLHSPDQVLCAFPQWFAAPQADWPSPLRFVGFPLYNRSGVESLSAATENFIAAGEAPLVFTAGSAMAHSHSYFALALEAVKKLNRRAIFVSRYKDCLPPLPDFVHHAQYEPFDILFSRAAFVSHHGGIGTSAQALNAAVPQLVAPFAHDQFDNAFRLKKLGVAQSVKADAFSESRAQDFTEKCRILLSAPYQEKAKEAARLMQDQSDAAARAALYVEELERLL